VQEVLRGYLGDRKSKAIFEKATSLGRAFSVLGDGYQRPFELATVRLNNMIGSLSNCAQQKSHIVSHAAGSLFSQRSCLWFR
jgi:hypothetical protein